MLHRPQTFTTNLQSESISLQTYENKSYVVAPCIALVPGVLNGDLVPLQVVTATYRAWNGRPVVVGHPYDSDGQSISANSLSVLETYGIGHVWNADIDDDRLRVEVWVDQEKAEKLGGDALKIVERLNSAQPIEVSTGYWANLHSKEGEYNGKPYEMVTELIVPDHLAILPNEVGACNWGDGCGIPRAMQQKKHMYFTPNITMSDTFDALRSVIEKEMKASQVEPYFWHLADIEDDFVIIGVGDSMQRRQFSVDEAGLITLLGEWEEVMKQTKFTPITNQRLKTFCKACNQMVDHAEEEEVQPVPEEGEEVPTHVPADDEEEYVMPKPVNPGGDPNLDNEDVGQPDPVEEENEEDGEVVNQKADTLSQFLAQHKMNKSALTAMVKARVTERKRQIAVIKAHTKLTDDDLFQMTDAALTLLAEKFEEDNTEVYTDIPTVYAGRGLSVNQSTDQDTRPARPSVLLKKVV